MLGRKIEEYKDKVDQDEYYQKIVYILSYIKQYEGPLPRRNYKKYRFYDERELRFETKRQSMGKPSSTVSI